MRVRPRDYLLIGCLLAMVAFVASNWSDYSACSYPLQVWLVVNFLSIAMFRVTQLLFEHALVTRWPTLAQKVLAALNLCILYPFMFVWAVLGSYWYHFSHACLPDSMGQWWFVAWLVYTYLYVVLFTAVIYVTVHRRLLPGQRNIRNVQALLTVFRAAQAYIVMDRNVQGAGLTDEQIQQLPKRRFVEPTERGEEVDCTCSICLEDVNVNETIHDLPCAHVHHQRCLDEWLSRTPKCPNCMRVIVPANEASSLV